MHPEQNAGWQRERQPYGRAQQRFVFCVCQVVKRQDSSHVDRFAPACCQWRCEATSIFTRGSGLFSRVRCRLISLIRTSIPWVRAVVPFRGLKRDSPGRRPDPRPQPVSFYNLHHPRPLPSENTGELFIWWVNPMPALRTGHSRCRCSRDRRSLLLHVQK